MTLETVNHEQISPELRKFLSSWLDWAENPPRWWEFWRKRYIPSLGLCGNCPSDAYPDLRYFLRRETESPYPFGGLGVFYRESDRETLHLNPERLAWVRKMLGRPNPDLPFEQPPA